MLTKDFVYSVNLIWRRCPILVNMQVCCLWSRNGQPRNVLYMLVKQFLKQMSTCFKTLYILLICALFVLSSVRYSILYLFKHNKANLISKVGQDSGRGANAPPPNETCMCVCAHHGQSMPVCCHYSCDNNIDL